MPRNIRWSFVAALALVGLALVGLGGTVRATVPLEIAAVPAAPLRLRATGPPKGKKERCHSNERLVGDVGQKFHAS